jgi:integrase
MGIQTRTLPNGEKRYKARVKHHGREVGSKMFTRKKDAQEWHDDQVRKLRLGEWLDPRRGQVALSTIAHGWLQSRKRLKKTSQRSDILAWERHIEPKFGRVSVASITTADVSKWVGVLLANGAQPSTAARYLASFRSLLEFAKEDERVSRNVAAAVKPPTAGRSKREGQFLSIEEVDALVDACDGHGADLIKVMAFGGMRWGELAGLRVGHRVSVPGPGLRLQKQITTGGVDGGAHEDTLKGHRARTIPLIPDLVPIVDAWAAGKKADDFLFSAPRGGHLHENNWKRSIGWSGALRSIGRSGFRVHDLRHTCASIWLGAGADPKVVQRILGHASATMTMDLYGHLIDDNLWTAAKKVGGLSGASDDRKAE